MSDWSVVPASIKGGFVPVLMDVEDHKKLDGRPLSMGSHGYAQGTLDGEVNLLHRWLMGLRRGDGYRQVVDHINRDKLDCRRANLRRVTPAESNLNRVIQARQLPTGIYLTRNGKFEVKFRRLRRRFYLGNFDTVEAALRARDSTGFEFLTA